MLLSFPNLKNCSLNPAEILAANLVCMQRRLFIYKEDAVFLNRGRCITEFCDKKGQMLIQKSYDGVFEVENFIYAFDLLVSKMAYSFIQFSFKRSNRIRHKNNGDQTPGEATKLLFLVKFLVHT